METGLTVAIDDREFEARLGNIIRQLRPGGQTAGLMRAVGYYMRRRTDTHFKDEKDPEGRAWEPLKECTIAGRRIGPRAKKRGGKRKIAILQDRGTLRRSINSIADATSAEIGTNLHYAGYHQFGAPRAHIPIRAFLGVADEDAEGIENLALDYLARVMGG